MPLYFNGSLLPAPSLEYVAWIDVMGIQSAMARSLDIASNFVFKLHSAALLAALPALRLYPVMDGLYVTSAQRSDMEAFLVSVYSAVADEFIQTSVPLHRFMIRGALAYGPVIHGSSVPSQASHPFGNAAGTAHKDAVLIGLPMVQAHVSEPSAPPFGVFVHESARTFAPAGTSPFHHVWWQWSQPHTNATWQAMPAALAQHFQWCKARPHLLLYDAGRTEAHDALAREYFT